MTSALKRAKQLTLHLAKRGGIFALARNSRWRTERLLILCYHGISLADEHQWDPALYMPPEMFRSRLAMLRDGGYTVLRLTDAIRMLYAGTLPERAVVITFDDGSYDFYAQAYPILREFDYPATVYLTTYYSNYQRPVFQPAASYILWKGRGGTFDGSGFVAGGGMLSLRTDSERLATFYRIRGHALANRISAEEKDQLAQALAARLGVDYQILLEKRLLHLMTPEEVAQLSTRLVDVQLHTHRHRMPRDRALFLRELRDNRRGIESMVGNAAELVHFCYPSGDYSPVFLPWLQEGGVESATTCDPGIATQQSDPLLLPRLVDTCSLSPIEFEGWVTGVAQFLPARRAGPGDPTRGA